MFWVKRSLKIPKQWDEGGPFRITPHPPTPRVFEKDHVYKVGGDKARLQNSSFAIFVYQLIVSNRFSKIDFKA
jgi:hypothetical protein